MALDGLPEMPRGELLFPPRVFLYKAAEARAGWRQPMRDETRVTLPGDPTPV